MRTIKFKEVTQNRPSALRAALSLGQYLATLKSDHDAEFAFLQFLFYTDNLPKAPQLTLRLRLYRRHDKYHPDLRTLSDELVGVEEKRQLMRDFQ